MLCGSPGYKKAGKKSEEETYTLSKVKESRSQGPAPHAYKKYGYEFNECHRMNSISVMNSMSVMNSVSVIEFNECHSTRHSDE